MKTTRRVMTPNEHWREIYKPTVDDAWQNKKSTHYFRTITSEHNSLLSPVIVYATLVFVVVTNFESRAITQDLMSINVH